VKRDGIDWPPIGEWKRGMGVNRLETFAKNLDISEAQQTDLLNSVPTPWARLLLFESALYDVDHPAHGDVVDQWRGLLGTIALAELLRLPFQSPIHIDLKQLNGASEIKDAFLSLRPQHLVNGTDHEQNSWHEFHMISVDNMVIGATSPRTLVFTGISHRCPQSIPFRSPQGRLTDPLKYYEKFGDTLFLKLLAQWLDMLIDRARNDDSLKSLLGMVPVSYGQTVLRREQLVEALDDWREEFPVERPARSRWPQSQNSPFTGPYSILRPIPRVADSSDLNKSDLFVADRNDVLVCYNPGRNSMLVNRNGTEIRDGGIRIYDGHWIKPTEPLPTPLTFLPPLRIIEDPAEFFETALIQAPLNSETSYSLILDSVHYLLPYKEKILDFFSPAEIVRNTTLRHEKANHFTVTLTIPLINSRAIRVSKDFRIDDDVVLSSQSVPDALAFWPNITCSNPGKNQVPGRYFYYKFNTGGTVASLDFQPLHRPDTERTMPSRQWMETRQPLAGFVGTVDQRKGLLLIKYQDVDPPTHNWKVSIDLGSTHTRVFRLEVEKQLNRWVAVDGGEIRPVEITPKVKALTPCPPQDLLENFFPADSTGRNAATQEFVSQIVLPQPNNENHKDWLPREGCIYQRSLMEGFPVNSFRHNFKWNSDTSDYALRAFLRCLLVMVQAQALSEGANVVSVSNSYPSVFTKTLVGKHKGEWMGLGNYSGLQIEQPLMEAEAVGRYLQVGEKAVVVENTIALDVGGSTTDVAIWTRNRLSSQVSVKMAAGIAGRYVQTESGAFRERLAMILAGQPFNSPLKLENFKNRESGYSLMFNAILNAAAARGHLNSLITSIQGSEEGKSLIAHIMYLFGALVYYVGILGRELKMDRASTFYIYYCGKGGQLLEWVENREHFVAEMFGAGLIGPGQTGGPKVAVKLARTTLPKEEVGRGLLADSALKADPDNPESGLLNLGPVKVLAGESGYGGLSCFDKLDDQVFASLPEDVPAYQDLKELNNFVKTFVNSGSTREAARLLGLTAAEPLEFRARLKEQLFGIARGRIRYDLVHHPAEALLESLFITEVKVLLETITGNYRLFM
jgi:hypothetical protein